ncbi:MAG TPA: adenylate kinase [Methanoregulaceae archaeon]|nr:adenylate kinase [Methanoregulaceae archaeon]
MAGTKCIITGVPGVGKTTVITGALAKLEEMGVDYANISFGSFMFEMALKKGLVQNRDEMRLLGKDDQKALQRLAAGVIAKTDGNVIVDTHASVKTPKGYLPRLPEWVLEELKPDLFVLIETDEDQILGRRMGDPSRVRDMDSYRALVSHQSFNRAIAAAYAMKTGCTVAIVTNADHLLDRAIDDLAALLT